MNKQALQAISVMLGAFPQSSTRVEALLRTYDAVLDGVDDQAIIEAAKRFTTGAVEGQNKTFAPSVAEFCTEARRIHEMLPYRNRRALPAPSRADRPYGDDARSKARMRLKMPLLQAAMAKGPAYVDALAKANAEGVESMILLAAEWGVPVPEELDGATNSEWITARNRALSEMERDPPPFMRSKPELMESIRAGLPLFSDPMGAGRARR